MESDLFARLQLVAQIRLGRVLLRQFAAPDALNGEGVDTVSHGDQCRIVVWCAARRPLWKRRIDGLYAMAGLLDSIAGADADAEVDALLDAYNEDRITFDRLLEELRALAARHWRPPRLRRYSRPCGAAGRVPEKSGSQREGVALAAYLGRETGHDTTYVISYMISICVRIQGGFRGRSSTSAIREGKHPLR